MAFSNDQFVEHAERALELFRTLSDTPKPRRLIQRAQSILEAARNDFTNGHNDMFSSTEDKDARDDEEEGEEEESAEVLEFDLVAIVHECEAKVRQEREEEQLEQEQLEQEQLEEHLQCRLEI
ncbi:unnamed protein product [Cercospora beticola]|nr:unnamed protein product [Cercospora beticola]